MRKSSFNTASFHTTASSTVKLSEIACATGTTCRTAHLQRVSMLTCHSVSSWQNGLNWKFVCRKLMVGGVLWINSCGRVKEAGLGRGGGWAEWSQQRPSSFPQAQARTAVQKCVTYWGKWPDIHTPTWTRKGPCAWVRWLTLGKGSSQGDSDESHQLRLT